jgi:hypothetical protein
MYTVIYEWDREELGIVTLEIGYDWSKPVPADEISPPEGGLELISIAATEIKWFDEDGNPLPRVATVEELSIAEQAFSGELAFELATADYEEKAGGYGDV